MKPPTVRLCLGLILIACVAPGVLASVDPLEDIGPTYTVVTDRTIDYVGGLQDLRRRRIRAIGSPEARVREDRLRMLRAIRFGRWSR